MELTRRQLLTLAGTATAAAVLAGCGGTLRPADITAPGFGENATGTLNLWCRSETVNGTQAVVDAFHQAQDRIRVTVTPIPGGQYVTKLATAIRGGHVPDVVDCDDINSTLFAYRDAFTDLTPLIEELGIGDALSPGHLALSTRDGRYYGVPFIGDFSVLFCNTELFERAGLDLERSTADFDGILEAARAITGLDDGVYGWTYPGNSSGALGFTVQPHVWATGRDLIAGEVGDQRGDIVGNDPLRRTLELEHTLWAEELVPPGSFADDASRWSADYVAGRIGMFPAGYGVVVPNADPELLARSQVVLLPGPDGGRSFFDGGDNLCIPNGAENASAAWEFIRFALDVQQQARMPEGFFSPVRSDVATPEFAESYPLAVPPLESLTSGYAPTTLAYNLIYNQQDGPWLRMFRSAVFDGEVDAAMQEAQTTYDRILRQAQA
ncbi:carbohydrate ABC transporter substrate-binding protein (CUT1 family) [Promicromonospora sp. AC04]|uniref:ABC transporter substrate-binding protein n=1 Tax=Promicromonospora sp. AC04 TaxID=2135723 RepID=UPI000D33E16E|nr:sugar ABC transporter substrate-binding protein [Promicromonospora sp. AC04]PUB31939.1 carbohydrate ABC transporter substrate-binding protein (CUT1 family) [Promicromonospora sp. AC04]